MKKTITIDQRTVARIIIGHLVATGDLRTDTGGRRDIVTAGIPDVGLTVEIVDEE